ncbi:helix-turn-helix transcriptional regulator [Clostridium botulinum]|uniref:DNA-binding protein n=1 Tax=Clostridium botulinum (strain Langeland / NCTC 10281 / Type F) TaxID=441772 RepID=A7GHR1_CLOBL|nr:helix-turn-helix transcriptional regulator [Clostridium botulinum]ABS40804.1 DNA-binding protein [Clostridium botulinum F str. Langeland]ADG00692.1 DNA-binding protein [Clostridium botulinum F str. 230613]KKM40804.1 DNA-binding protein [Clostridium botulinum]MBY6792349.1 helix-turn-helix transcriptional regulator [Clostridium botulinum]MBY6938009.1 helix-turn-helix transcriptional regulator [Clostridium botulinum]
MTTAKKLKAYRCLKGAKQEDIARLIGVSLNTYNFKENGKKSFTLNEAKIISDFFDTTIDELFFRRNSKL